MKKYLFLLPLIALWGCQTSKRPSITQVPSERPWVIEIDGKGRVANERNLKEYCDEIAKKPQTVVVFIHGWHGSASKSDANMQKYAENLQKVRTRAFTKAGRTLTGVVITWPARTFPSVLEYFPGYYVTRAHSDRISKADGVTRALEELSHAQRGSGEHIIVAGHSMGARILGRVIREKPELMRDLDLVLLANTADGAHSCSRTLDALDAHPYPRGRLPKLVWVTSAHDIVMRIIYPIFDAEVAPGYSRLRQYDVAIKIPTPEHPYYSADIEKNVPTKGSQYAHNIRVIDGLEGHSDIWSESMNQIVNYYVLRGN
jgi:pimeloyl-ACP methyl ester carboxylesterase